MPGAMDPVPGPASRTRGAGHEFHLKRQLQTRVRRLAARSARAMPKRFALSIRGRGECRVPSAPAASCAHDSGSMHTSIHSEFTGIARHSRTQWFTAYIALSPERSAHLPPSPRGLKVLSDPVEPNEPPQDLTPAPRRQDHTTSPSADSISAKSSTRLVAPKLQRRRKQRRRLACRSSLTESNPPCASLARPTLPRPPHLVPRP
jgi:hypothetical protein